MPTPAAPQTVVAHSTPAPAVVGNSGKGQKAIVSTTAAPTSVIGKGSVPAAQVILEPRASEIGSSPVAVDIVIENVNGLYGVEVHLVFDPAVVQVQDADPNTPEEQIAPGPPFHQGNSFVALNRADNKAGTVDFAVALLNPALPLQGRVVVATFHVVAAKAGVTEVKFAEALLASRDGEALESVSRGIALNARPR